MQQRKAFTALLTVSLAEASKLNDKACFHEMQSLDLAMHIAAGTLPQAYALVHQVVYPAGLHLLWQFFCYRTNPVQQLLLWVSDSTAQNNLHTFLCYIGSPFLSAMQLNHSVGGMQRAWL